MLESVAEKVISTEYSRYSPRTKREHKTRYLRAMLMITFGRTTLGENCLITHNKPEYDETKLSAIRLYEF